MIKYFWKNHRAFCYLVLAYAIPAGIAWPVTGDTDLAVSIGGVCTLLASPLIWKYA